MKFDQTYIEIRKRNLLEIVDLSLIVIRDYFLPLSVLGLIGCIPFFIANGLLLGWLAADYYDYESLTLYCYVSALLIFSQSQIATTFITNYLGEAIFSEEPSIYKAIQNSAKLNFLHFLWINGILRMVIPAFLIALLINADADDDSIVNAVAWLSIVVFVYVIARGVRPFSNEIMCLERPPVFKKQNGRINYSLRSSSLHRAANAEIMGRFVLSSVLMVPFFIVLLGSLLIIDSMLNLHADMDTLPIVIYFPIALWILACFFSVVRFLSYIDIRIRQEGWEVELRMRAEAIRIKGLQDQLT